MLKFKTKENICRMSCKKYDTFKIPHTKFMNLIKKYGLEETINTSCIDFIKKFPQ